MDTRPLRALEDLDAYRRLFTDVSLWTPYVEEVLRRHGLQPQAPVQLGVPGTCPTFLVAQRWVVKFFGRLFEGAQSFAAEQEAARMTTLDPGIGAITVAGTGELAVEGWPWPYLIFPFVNGKRIGAWVEQIEPAEMLRVAGEMGERIRRLHGLSLSGSTVFPDTHKSYRQFLAEQRTGLTRRLREWGSLPDRLIEEVDAYMPPIKALVDTTRPPHLIHADLTSDHLLGVLEDGRWRTTALIDFGDARTGDMLYELGALQLDLFRGDLRLLAAFLDAYRLPAGQRETLPDKALATALLHQFDLFASMRPAVNHAESLKALAQALFGPPVTSGVGQPARMA